MGENKSFIASTTENNQDLTFQGIDEQFKENEIRCHQIPEIKSRNIISLEIDKIDIAETIQRLKNNLCKSIDNGSIEFYVDLSTGGDLGIVSGNIRTGIKVKIRCDVNTEKPKKSE